jgi:formylmethanofuran dehydrogenase subunit E
VDPTIEKLRAFHGHLCPGVTIGVRAVAPEPPERNRVMKRTSCDACGESVMISRAREQHGRTLGIPCFERAQAGGEAVSH